jgi:hypothetical protein
MGSAPIFAIFPYLKTENPVEIRGIRLRSSADISGWSRDIQKRLKTLFGMFLMRENQRIAQMTYTCWTGDDDRDATLSFLRQLDEAHTLIAYLYSSPHPSNGRPFLHLEHSSFYMLSPDRMFKSNAELEHGLVQTIRRPAKSARTTVASTRAGWNERVPSYSGSLDRTRYVHIAFAYPVLLVMGLPSVPKERDSSSLPRASNSPRTRCCR